MLISIPHQLGRIYGSATSHAKDDIWLELLYRRHPLLYLFYRQVWRDVIVDRIQNPHLFQLP